ncbi:threonine/serine exporter family protein [Carboxydothermus ferrireducens]|uniref:Uncharacterized membrane protein YjjB (DUF3815 family) n=1 Tax=Carboxydothermus ferrireducens DSM 11255 TaxID=1119529 RepID=A0ABX2RC23_9THEO|nr:threonine/serine exporter family protein [Carboxydothermus ferrireducens]NYE57432.1 uncharacterized membrane protein YjjB (DUF3815 family) [Carboxydothermus ferrireducens DSM 11255]
MDVLYAFFLSFFFGILFNAPMESLFYGGLTGAGGYLVYTIAGQTPLAGVFFGSLTVGVLSEILARLKKKPTIIFTTTGLIPLVPGKLAYDTITAFIREDFSLGVSLGLQTFFSAGAIALGIAITSSVMRLYKKATQRRQ